MKRFIKEKTLHIVYDSIHDFFNNTSLKNPPEILNKKNKEEFSDLKSSDSSWRFGDDYDRETFYENRFDSSKGKKMCHDEVKKTLAEKTYKDLVQQALTYRKRIFYQDSGSRLSIPKVIAGEDKYFITYKNSKKPVVKIAINICGSASVDEDAFKKIAKTAVPTIYALETAGIATEVYYTAFASGTHETVADYTATHVKIKSAEQRFNWTTFAPIFCLGSYRESIFLSWIYDEAKIEYGLGRPMSEKDLEKQNNFGYSAVIGLNAVGPVNQIKQLFSKLKKT